MCLIRFLEHKVITCTWKKINFDNVVRSPKFKLKVTNCKY